MLSDAHQTGVRTEPAADTVCDYEFIYRGVRECFRHERSSFLCSKARSMYIISNSSSQEDCIQTQDLIRPIPGAMATIEKIQSALHDRFIDGWFCLRSPLPRCNRLSGSRASISWTGFAGTHFRPALRRSFRLFAVRQTLASSGSSVAARR